MDRRQLLATIGAVSIGIAGCLDQATDAAPSETDDEDSGAGSSDDEPSSNGDEEADSNGENGPDSSDAQTPKETIEAFANGFRDDDLEAVRETLHPDSEFDDVIDRTAVESVTFEIETLDLLEETGEEATVEIAWTVSEDDEGADEQELEASLRRTEDRWKILELGSEDNASEEARAAVDVDVTPDTQTVTVMVTSLGNADGVYVSGESEEPDSCTEPMDSAGDSCEFEGEGTYTVIAYIEGDSDADDIETVVHSFEVDE